MPMAMTDVRKFCSVAAVLAATTLAGCASDDTTARLLVPPDKYVLYNCAELARQMPVKLAREKELRELMAKASVDPAGRGIGGLAYDSEYLLVRGEINDLRATAADKHCSGMPTDAAPAPVGAIH
ncbi:MAG: hypothetical protein ACREB2_01225 [Pseudolabrys sp.]